MLADAPPQNWDEARRRLAVVRRYLAGEEKSAAAADACAAEIGIGRSLFYRLAKVYAGKPVDTEAEALSGHVLHPVERETVQAIEQAGRSANHAQIFRSVVQICREQGRPVPSRRAVRAVAARLLAGRSVAARIGVEADFAIDRAILELDVAIGEEKPLPAQLLCLVDVSRGVIASHMLAAGDPVADQVRSILEDVAIRGRRIAVSTSDPALLNDPIRSFIVGKGGMLIPGRWRLGTAIRAAAGLRLGRLLLLARPPGSTEARPSVALDTAQSVVAELVGRHLKDIG